MSKAILIIDMPESCSECPFYSGVMGGRCLVDMHKYNSREIDSLVDIERREWCPLKEIPDKKSEFSAQNDYILFSAKGWNNCINEILK